MRKGIVFYFFTLAPFLLQACGGGGEQESAGLTVDSNLRLDQIHVSGNLDKAGIVELEITQAGLSEVLTDQDLSELGWKFILPTNGMQSGESLSIRLIVDGIYQDIDYSSIISLENN